MSDQPDTRDIEIRMRDDPGVEDCYEAAGAIAALRAQVDTAYAEGYAGGKAEMVDLVGRMRKELAFMASARAGLTTNLADAQAQLAQAETDVIAAKQYGIDCVSTVTVKLALAEAREAHLMPRRCSRGSRAASAPRGRGAIRTMLLCFKALRSSCVRQPVLQDAVEEGHFRHRYDA